MIRHVVLFKFAEGTPDSARSAMADGLGSLAGKIAVIQAWSQGMNAIASDRNYDFCLVADFACEDDLQRYQVHPAHQDVVQRLIRPVVQDVKVVDFSVPA